MKRIIKLGILVLLLLPLLSSCATKTVVVKCPASGATITVDGEYAGHQQATFRVKYIGWKSVTVSAPQYLIFKIWDKRRLVNVIRVFFAYCYVICFAVWD